MGSLSSHVFIVVYERLSLVCVECSKKYGVFAPLQDFGVCVVCPYERCVSGGPLLELCRLTSPTRIVCVCVDTAYKNCVCVC